MIILKFEQSERAESYHLFETVTAMRDYLTENYDNVLYYPQDGMVCMEFDGIRTHANIISPIIHINQNQTA